jgi:hypothetical protein
MTILQQLTDFIADNYGWLVVLVGIIAGYVKLDQRDKEAKINSDERKVLAETENQNADSAIINSQAKQANTISELALEQSRDSRKTFELIMQLQQQITTLEKANTRTEAKLENAEAQLEQEKLARANFEERYETDRLKWEADRQEWKTERTKLMGVITARAKTDAIPLPNETDNEDIKDAA